MFKGKEKQIDENEVKKSLPHNRKELFFDLLKHRKMDMFYLSSLTFIFFIPLAVDLLFFNYLEAIATANENYQDLFSLVFYSMLIMLPCMLILFIGLAGAFYTAKKMVWQELIIPAHDFFQGIKENWKHSLISGVIFGVITFGLVVGGTYLLIYSPMPQVWNGVSIGALVVVFLTLGMVTALIFTQDVYYSNSYYVTFKNAFSFMALTNWKVLLIYLLSTGALVALAALNTITLIVGIVLFAILNYVVVILYTLISHAAFDKYINKDNYPEMVNKGLYKQEDVKEA